MTPADLREIGARGNQTMRRRYELKRDLATGRLHLADLLADPPEFAEGMRLSQVIFALRGIGRKTGRQALLATKATDFTTLGGLTERQREALLSHFRRRHPSAWRLWEVMARGPNRDESA